MCTGGETAVTTGGCIKSKHCKAITLEIESIENEASQKNLSFNQIRPTVLSESSASSS